MWFTILKGLFSLSPFILIGGGYLYLMNNEIKIDNLQTERTELTQEVEQLRNVIDNDRAEFDRIQSELRSLQTNMAKSEERTRDLVTTLRSNDLTYLTLNKPGLIETRINRGTRNVFENLERITNTSDNDRL